MRLLLINHYAGAPQLGMEYRPYYLARAWQRRGSDVRIVGASYSHLRTTQPTVEAQGVLEDIGGVPYMWLPTPGYQGSGVRRAANMFAFVAQLHRVAGRLAREFAPDAVIASSTYPLDAWPARRIARASGAKLVYEVHDLWPLSPIELGGLSPGHPFIRVMQWAENYACRNADVVASMLPGATDHLVAHGMHRERFVHVPNGVAVEEWVRDAAPLPPLHREVIGRLRAEERFLVGYAGSHGVANGLDTLVEAGRLLARDRVGILLVGDGPDKSRLQARAREIGAESLSFLPSVAKAAVPTLLSEMDALYVGFLRRPRLYRHGVSPNKLMDYMMAGRPVISAIEAWNDPVAEARCGLSIAPEDPQALADAVRSLSALSREERQALGIRGREHIMRHHDYDVIAERFLAALQG